MTNLYSALETAPGTASNGLAVPVSPLLTQGHPLQGSPSGGFLYKGSVVFILVQIPFADLRRFLKEPVPLLPKPVWKAPLPGADFVRRFGEVKRRRLGGHGLFCNEDVFCNADRLIKFGQDGSRWGSSSQLPCRGRRIFFDGTAVLRFELSLETRSYRNELTDMVTEILNKMIDVGGVVSRLGESGKVIAEAYAQATSPTTALPPINPLWTMAPLTPLVIVSRLVDQSVPPPLGFHPVRLSKVTKRSPELVSVHHRMLPIRATSASVYCVSVQRRCMNRRNDSGFRNLRIVLARTHAEKEVLSYTLRQIFLRNLVLGRGSGCGQVDDILQAYLGETASRLLLKSEQFSCYEPSPTDVMGAELIKEVHRGCVDALLKEVAGIRGNYLRSVEAYLKRGDASILNFGVLVQGDNLAGINQTDNRTATGGAMDSQKPGHSQNVQIGGDNSGAIVQAIANRITDSFKAADGKLDKKEDREELKKLLAQLQQQSQSILPALPAESREEFAQSVEGLVKESAKEKPIKRWYEASKDGIVEAAQALGEAAEPIIKTAVAVAAYLATVAT